MPLARRLPKRGFTSLTAGRTAEVTLGALQKLPVTEVDLLVLKQAGLVSHLSLGAKVVLSGSIEKKAVTLKGIAATKGARAAIEAAGGSIAE